MTAVLRALRRSLLVTAYRLLYREFGFGYDAVSWAVSAGRWWDWLARVVPFVGAGPVLEIGCGPGHLLARLRRAGRTVVGLDRSPGMARRATSFAGPGVVVLGDVYTLPIATGSVGSVVVTFPPPFIRDGAALREIRRVLRDDGRLVLLEGGAPPRSAFAAVAGLVLAVTGAGGAAAPGPALDVPLRSAGFRVRRFRVSGRFGRVWLTVAVPSVDAAAPRP